MRRIRNAGEVSICPENQIEKTFKAKKNRANEDGRGNGEDRAKLDCHQPTVQFHRNAKGSSDESTTNCTSCNL